MNDKVLRKLEFDKIIEKLAACCVCGLGRDLALSLKPLPGLYQVNAALDQTSEAKEVLRLFPNFALSGIRDVRPPLQRATAGGIVEAPEFIQILDTLAASRRIKAFLEKEAAQLQTLTDSAYGLHVFEALERQIRKCITDEGEVADGATEELKKIRRQLRSYQGKAREKLESFIRNPEILKYLQDPIITLRNDRYVIPVRQEYRQKLPGLIHDQSGSGATLFIEPMAVVELNNETRRLESAEKAEVARILRELTQKVYEHGDELEETLESLAELDFAFAKAKLSAGMDCGRPLVNDQGQWRIVQGIHPLIQGKAVPITVSLGQKFSTLVVTGPNTGGKTVTLKTIGLLTLMGQSGLHVPAQEGTELAVCEQIFVDIGDEQSIEQSLSTFSSHMTNLVSILEQIRPNNLALLDELGAGTDPAEGAALAMAILEHLIRLGAKTVATTHYSELKSFAFNHENAENASVEFDVETLRPTYRLLIGVPGKSNAFEISRRLGLGESVIQRARSLLSQEELRISDLLANLESNQLMSEKERTEAQELRQLAQIRFSLAKHKEEEAEQKVKKMLEKAKADALEIITQARRESEDLLKEIKGIQKEVSERSQAEARRVRDALRHRETRIHEEMDRAASSGPELSAGDLEPGDQVLIRRLGQKAQVLAKPTAQGDVLVQAGVMKVAVKLRDLDRLDEGSPSGRREKTGVGALVADKARNIKLELDLRGLTVDEALIETEKYLDDAYLSGAGKVTIIHGKGTGALRSAVTDMVRRHPLASASRTGGYSEGGHGVTVVELKPMG
ncbi:MAG: endonuclease MutS2 [Peptococcaceae bacterium]|nr:endonuclease MutS2 [Peptococcaceae bacterium]